MKILLLDIETSPLIAYAWRTFKEYIAPGNIIEPVKLLCVTAKWYGDPQMYFAATWDGHKTMLKQLHKLVNEADVVVHYNGLKFDMPHINREFLEHGFTPPSPYKQVDLFQVMRRTFRFESNKMGYITDRLDLGQKGGTDFTLWKRVMAKDPDAYLEMQTYNQQDVVLLEELYTKLRPWIEKHPNYGAFNDTQCCPKCGSTSFQRRGTAVTNIARYVRYQCKSCGGWFRSSINLRPSGDKTRNVNP